MARYYGEARELAALFNACQGVSTRPEVPVSNMFHVHFRLPEEKVAPILANIAETTGVGLSSWLREKEAGPCFFEISIGDRYANVPKEKIEEAFRLLGEQLEEAIK